MAGHRGRTDSGSHAPSGGRVGVVVVSGGVDNGLVCCGLAPSGVTVPGVPDFPCVPVRFHVRRQYGAITGVQFTLGNVTTFAGPGSGTESLGGYGETAKVWVKDICLTNGMARKWCTNGCQVSELQGESD